MELRRELWQSERLAAIPGVAHGITRRVQGLGLACGNVGYSPPRDRIDAWKMRQRWCGALGVSAERLVVLSQVHGSEVHVASASRAGWGARPGSRQIGRGDALMTGEAGPVLLTLHADCQPVMFVAPGTWKRDPIIAVAHAGWRGTVAGIVPATIAAMRAHFGARAADVFVALGPAIGPCCYEVGDDVASSWRGVAGSEAGIALESRNGRYLFDLTKANRLLLERAGVRAENIESAVSCTRCEGERWFSHRGQGADTGRFGAMITITGSL